MKYNSKVNIMRMSQASDGQGGFSKVPAIFHKNLPCRINWKTGSQRLIFDKNSWYRDAVLYSRVVDITTKDTVVYNNVTYDVVDVKNPDNANKRLKVTMKAAI